MEDGVWSQIMKIQAIVEHEPPHKGVEGEAQASEEVWDKHNTLVGLRRRDNLPRAGSLCRMSAVRYPTSLSLVISSSWIEEDTHRPLALDPDILEDLGC